MNSLLKRLFDILFSGCALLILSPLMAGISILVWIKIGRPIIFAQSRPGYKGRAFTMYKFRSMSDLRDHTGRELPDEQRLTPFGAFLRASSLDELPEFFNVLKGEMSVVGPRPLLLEYLSRYSPEQARRHDVKPGITGWAQVNGRNHLTHEQKFVLDVWYVDHWNLLVDLKIIVMTLGSVIRREGISSHGRQTAPKFGESPQIHQAGEESSEELNRTS